MAIAFRASNGAVSATIPKPTGTVDGDLLVAIVSNTSSTTPSAAGWTILDPNTATSVRAATFWKIASSEPASWTFSNADLGLVMAFSGASGIDDHSINIASGTPITATGVTASAANDALVWVGLAQRSGANPVISAPTGFTTPAISSAFWQNGTRSPIIYDRIAFYYQLGLAAGATGDVSASVTNSPTYTNGFLIAISENTATDATVTLPLATATGAGLAPVIGVAPDLALATATGVGLAPSNAITLTLPLATASGAGLAPVPSILLDLGLATATGLAYVLDVASGTVIALPLATATATGFDAGLMYDSSVALPLATATGDAYAPVNAILLDLGLATAIATAYLPSLSYGGSVALPLATATGTGLAPSALIALGLTTANAQADGFALDAGIGVPLGLATATGAGLAPIIALALGLPTASATGAGLDLTPTIALPLGLATATGAGMNASIGLALDLGLASATVVAYDTDAVISTLIALGLATATATGYELTPRAFRSRVLGGRIILLPALDAMLSLQSWDDARPERMGAAFTGSVMLLPVSDTERLIIVPPMTGSTKMEPE